MSFLNDIFNKVFHRDVQSGAPSASTSSPVPSTSAPALTQGAGTAAPTAASATPMTDVDVSKVLDGLAAQSAEKLDWHKSIVDLMKLLGIDSSLSARKALASELHFTGDTNDSASMNVWLHRQVMNKLASNGGKVPADLRD